MREFAQQYIDPFFNLLNYDLFTVSGTRVTPSSILIGGLLIVALVYLSGKFKDLLLNRMLTRTNLDQGARDAIGTITRYVIIFIGLLVVFQTIGINLTALSVLTGAVGIGIGFGLQNVANNFISGLIILFERPIKVGDRIVVGEISGDVVAIKARSTYVRTNDNITVIVPNSKFISENVINWGYDGGMVRFKIPVGVAYDSDVDLVTKTLTDIAIANPDVADDPPPTVRLLRFDENALYFELRAWSSVRLHRPGMFTSDINYDIVKQFRDKKIEMPFPQRDIHVRSGSLVIERGRKNGSELSAEATSG